MKIKLPVNERFTVKRAYDTNPLSLPFPLHAHEHYELLLFLSGDITYLVEGCHYTPRHGDILVFNIAETHRVIVNSDIPYERLVIQIDRGLLCELDTDGKLRELFENRKPGEANIIHTDCFQDDFWARCVERIPDSVHASQTELFCIVFFLLREIAIKAERMENEKEEIPLPAQIVRYINENITKELTPAKIAELFFISRTALYTMFRQTTGSCIHEYITLKRLLSARELLAKGQPPKTVYLKCGFRDYSTFYRAYKKRFSEPPVLLSKK